MQNTLNNKNRKHNQQTEHIQNRQQNNKQQNKAKTMGNRKNKI